MNSQVSREAIAEEPVNFPVDKTDEYDVRPRTGHEKREQLLTHLLFTSRRLAEGQIVIEQEMFHCAHCGEFASMNAGRVCWHRGGCAVGQVLAIILELQKVGLDHNFNQRKESAPKGDNDGAGDGLRPPVDYRTPWQLSKGIRTTIEGTTAAVTHDGARVFDLAFHELPVVDAEEFARRIVLCVNTCAGLSTEALEKLEAIRCAGSDQ